MHQMFWRQEESSINYLVRLHACPSPGRFSWVSIYLGVSGAGHVDAVNLNELVARLESTVPGNQAVGENFLQVK